MAAARELIKQAYDDDYADADSGPQIKAWLIRLGPEYASAKRKLQAIEHIARQGAATEGMRKYAEALKNAPGGTE